MADIEFGDMRNGSDGFDIVVSQSVAGMNLQPEIGAEFRRVADMLQQSAALAARGVGVSPGVQFHDRRAQLARRIELLAVEARVVVAGVDTYLKYAEAVGLTAAAAA